MERRIAMRTLYEQRHASQSGNWLKSHWEIHVPAYQEKPDGKHSSGCHLSFSAISLNLPSLCLICAQGSFMKSLTILALLSVPCAQAAQFRHHTIDDKVGIGYGVAIADVNGDKKPDILLVDKAEVSWYENPSWQKHVIAEKLTQLDHVCIAAQDIDGDGKAEIAIGAGWNPGDTVNSGAVFYLVAPEDRTQKWKAIELHHEPTVHRMWWITDGSGKYSLVVLPLHGRGNKNGEGEPVRMLEYLKPADSQQNLTTNLIPVPLHLAHNFDPVANWDVVHKHMLVAGKEGVFDASYGHEDPSGPLKWIVRPVITPKNTGFLGAGEVRRGELSNNRFIATIEPMHGTNIAVYPHDSKWKRVLLDDKISDGHALATGDLLHKGRDQIVAGWRGKNAEGKVGVKIFTPTDDTGEHWKGELVDDNGMACEDLRLADLDGDGWLDIVASGRATKNLKIYWNENGKSK
jgi:hypothetical protein